MIRCEKATGNIVCLRVLNNNHENWKLVAKLPKWVADRWRRIVHYWKTEEVTFPPLSEFVTFMSREAGSVYDPVLKKIKAWVSSYLLKKGRGWSIF